MSFVGEVFVGRMKGLGQFNPNPGLTKTDNPLVTSSQHAQGDNYSSGYKQRYNYNAQNLRRD